MITSLYYFQTYCSLLTLVAQQYVITLICELSVTRDHQLSISSQISYVTDHKAPCSENLHKIAYLSCQALFQT